MFLKHLVLHLTRRKGLTSCCYHCKYDYYYLLAQGIQAIDGKSISLTPNTDKLQAPSHGVLRQTQKRWAGIKTCTLLRYHQPQLEKWHREQPLWEQCDWKNRLCLPQSVITLPECLQFFVATSSGIQSLVSSPLSLTFPGAPCGRQEGWRFYRLMSPVCWPGCCCPQVVSVPSVGALLFFCTSFFQGPAFEDTSASSEPMNKNEVLRMTQFPKCCIKYICLLTEALNTSMEGVRLPTWAHVHWSCLLGLLCLSCVAWGKAGTSLRPFFPCKLGMIVVNQQFC